MSRTKAVPAYRLHKSTGQAVVTIPLPGGRRKDIYLGTHESPESRKEYARIIGELAEGNAERVAAPNATAGLGTVDELLAAFTDHAEKHYRRADGTPTSEVREYLATFCYVRRLYGHTSPRDFGPLALKAVRRSMIDAKLCRGVVNQRVGRIKRLFKWGASEELIPASVFQSLGTVTGLQAGRTSATEREPIGPVDDATVDATIPYLNRFVRGLVEFQRLTGSRPSEACLIRRRNIDTGGSVWLYRPTHHKLAYKNKSRVIAIGPKCQELVKVFFTTSIDDYLFSPIRAVEEHQAARGNARQTPRWPSHMESNAAKRVKNPKIAPTERYDVASYRRAVHRAVKLANRAGEKAAKKAGAEYKPIPHWSVNRLRHSFATRVRKQHGLEAVQVLLGHVRADVTQVYAERNEALAVEVALRIG